MKSTAEFPSLLEARGASTSTNKSEFKNNGVDGNDFREQFDVSSNESGDFSKEFGSIFDETSFEDLDDILAIGEPQMSSSSSSSSHLAQLNDIATANEPKVLVAAEEPPETYADEGKQIILNVLDELIDGYQEEAFQALLLNLLETENKLMKRQARAPLLRLKGREKLCRSVLHVVLPKHGFDEGPFSLAARPYFNDADLQDKSNTIDVLLGLPLKSTLQDLRCWVKAEQPHLKTDTVFNA